MTIGAVVAAAARGTPAEGGGGSGSDFGRSDTHRRSGDDREFAKVKADFESAIPITIAFCREDRGYAAAATAGGRRRRRRERRTDPGTGVGTRASPPASPAPRRRTEGDPDLPKAGIDVIVCHAEEDSMCLDAAAASRAASCTTSKRTGCLATTTTRRQKPRGGAFRGTTRRDAWETDVGWRAHAAAARAEADARDAGGTLTPREDAATAMDAASLGAGAADAIE